MNKNQSNTGKILKLVDKFETEDLPELNNVWKDHLTKKILTKSQEYSDIAEKLRSQSEKIKGE